MIKRFSLSALLFVLLLGACVPLRLTSPTETPTLAPTSTSTKTHTPSPTQTHTPTCTPSPTPAPPTSTPTMTNAERAAQRLYKASLNYVAETPLEANEKVKAIDFLESSAESPDNACGPLTVAILRDGGFLPEDSPVHDMWLLCLREDEKDEDLPYCFGTKTLNQIYFPPDQYDYIRVEQSIGSYNFKKHPLKVGDWLFLFVKKGISNYNGFDHMLVVTRVDENGAAYSVTNINHGEGFVILEELLYDPTRPGVGLFYELTNDELRQELGMTGTGGFLLVRSKTTP